VHHTHHQGATQAQLPMSVAVLTAQVFPVILGVRVCMHVSHAALMFMNMKMNSLRPKFSEDIGTEKHKHQTNKKLEQPLRPR